MSTKRTIISQLGGPYRSRAQQAKHFGKSTRQIRRWAESPQMRELGYPAEVMINGRPHSSIPQTEIYERNVAKQSGIRIKGSSAAEAVATDPTA